MMRGKSLAITLASLIGLGVLVNAHADVDPGMVGTWEVSGVNAQGPWKLTWNIRADSSYTLSGLFNAQAMTWFRKAAEIGNVEAAYCIGHLYSEGTGVAKDEVAAADWYRKGAGRGEPNAMNELGGCYWLGNGVQKSAREAISWWKQAAEKGSEEAKKNLKVALEKFDESGQPRTRK
jgi:TPR repeat protein